MAIEVPNNMKESASQLCQFKATRYLTTTDAEKRERIRAEILEIEHGLERRIEDPDLKVVLSSEADRIRALRAKFRIPTSQI
jgi:hypothetical protein